MIDLTDARALTVRQPWAECIARGAKLIENRGPGFADQHRGRRGPLLIHAGAGWSYRGQTDQRVIDLLGPVRHPVRVAGLLMDDDLEPGHSFSRILAVAELVDVHPNPWEPVGWGEPPTPGCCHPWGEDTYTNAEGNAEVSPVTHLVLRNVRRLDCWVGAKGRLGMWKPDAELLEQVADATA